MAEQMSLNILGYVYVLDASQSIDDLKVAGRSSPLHQTIVLARELSEQQKQSTLLHEVLELLNHHLGLELRESKILALEAGLYYVLTQNGVELSPLLGGGQKCQ